MSNPGDSFKRFLILSIFFHLAIFLLLTVKVLFFPTQSPEFKRAMRVDIVALPEKTQNQPKPKTVKKPEPIKKDSKKTKVKTKKKTKKKKKATLKKRKKKQSPKKQDSKLIKNEQDSAIARLKALQKLKNKQQPPDQEVKGNVLSKGNSLSGLEKLHHESYLDRVDQHIRSHWNLPEWLANGNFKAIVLLKIDKRGSIKEKAFITKSGNPLFDHQVSQTLDKANPLPPPPASLVDFFAAKGVEIRFPD